MPPLHRTIRDIRPADWDGLAGDNAFAAHGWLLTVENTCRFPLEPLYFTVRRGGELAAASVCYVFGKDAAIETLDDMVFGRLKHSARAAGFSFLPAMVCGPLLGYGWHIGVAPSLDEDAAAGARRELLDAMETEARSRRYDLSFAHVLDEESGLRDLLGARGYVRCRNVPVGVLDLPHASFDDYLASLPGKNRREFRRQINRNQESGSLTRIGDFEASDQDHLLELLDSNARKHGAGPFAFGAGFFCELQRNLGPRARIFISRNEGRITGVMWMLVRNQTAFPVAVGVDDADPDYTYFQATYYSPIAHAIGEGIRRMYYGRGMYEVKVRRGCRLADTWIYTRPSGARRLASALWFPLASRWNRLKLPPMARRSLRAGPEGRA